VKSLLAAIVAWTLFALALLVFDPAFVQPPTCMRLVGRSAECQAIADAWNQTAWTQHTLPLLLAIAAGYVGILVVAIRGQRRRARGVWRAE
jgi:hypothetical protein